MERRARIGYTAAMPTARPHDAVWPRRLPRALVVPETTLWFNVEVSATRYPRKALYLFFGRELTFADFKRQAEHVAGWLASIGVAQGRSRRAVHAELPAVRDRALRASCAPMRSWCR